MHVVVEQVRAVPDVHVSRPNRRYPVTYNNEEGNSHVNFQPHEIPEGATLYEVPIPTRLDMNRRTACLDQVNAAVHRNDRDRPIRQSLNDPGPFRGIVPADRRTGQVYPLAGVNYHPTGNLKGFNRASLEPMNREGRQFMNRYNDDAADPHRVSTWPPRDEDGEDLSAYERRAAIPSGSKAET
ncbi:hypothetical protein NKR23_g189 [Pleurostoma richardsiae]|uniref:Uncharacterized protein n=1 Tax=Pleurostoma richardsiae TaxID=41990 RepID=A0AA38S2B8_9PEZI|nr:hypothetical protein NKR23_g189 [Pleurostoma richardsiae]